MTSSALDAYNIVPLSSFLDTYGMNTSQTLLDRFVPLIDAPASDYLRKHAISMEKRDLSRTYIALTPHRTILGFVAIGMKCIRIPQENLLSGNTLRQCNIEESTGVAQSYLLGQFARSSGSPRGFGDILMEYAIGKLTDAKSIVGCRMIRLDCTDELVNYYSKRGFRLISKDASGLNRMMRFI